MSYYRSQADPNITVIVVGAIGGILFVSVVFALVIAVCGCGCGSKLSAAASAPMASENVGPHLPTYSQHSRDQRFTPANIQYAQVLVFDSAWAVLYPIPASHDNSAPGLVTQSTLMSVCPPPLYSKSITVSTEHSAQEIAPMGIVR
ncbi:hypothetical protein FA15DRAFT_708816 [Coprinopsis marcescibilis]|uniref:Uncharacterized protein n=1 Tax=Coprinopsis marcescibilis TaxID=230819 RepID=A0A5C3KHG4_COPMA|nr:hypothetical protein FA15DRAFT_708816 [Coprinopsis marcescibilis]